MASTRIKLKLDNRGLAKLEALTPKVIDEELLPSMVETAKRLVPVDTGKLRDNIFSEHDNEAAYLVAETEYAAAVELGTSTSRAQPFLRPAVTGD